MKKTIFIAFIVASTLIVKSQILNNSFENLNSNGSIKNWGALFLWSASLDSNGVFVNDSIIFDNQLYFSTSDAHTGSKALEMRNAYNYTTGQKIAGKARLTQNDTDYAAFTQIVSIPQRPSHLTFYYKFLPVGNDTANAYLSVLDSNGVEIGYANIDITSAASAYSLASQAVAYSSQDPAAYVAMGFSTAKPYSIPSFGTRFLVDDVNLLITGIKKHTGDGQLAKCFPNPANEFVNLLLNPNLGGQPGTIEIFDIQGQCLIKIPVSGADKIVRIETGELPKGQYQILFKSEKNSYSAGFIK